MASSLLARGRPVYLVDLHCYKPPEELRVKKEDLAQLGKTLKVSAAGRWVLGAAGRCTARGCCAAPWSYQQGP